MTDFVVRALPRDAFAAAYRDPAAVWLEVDANPGYPCRVSLQDAEIGERVLALTYLHHDVDSPYRASGPIFVREHAVTCVPAPNEIPEMLLHRTLSVRGYDAAAMMIAAEIERGTELDEVIRRIFENTAVQYLHVHNAGPGCFNCMVERYADRTR